MRKITAGVISLVFLFSMVVSSTTFSFAEDSVAEDQEQVDVVAEEVEPLEEEETVPVEPETVLEEEV